MAWKVAVILVMLAAVAFGTVDWKARTDKGETLVESKSGGHYWTTKTSSFSKFTEIFHEYRMDSGYGSVKKAAAKVQFMSVSFVNRGTRYGDYADAYMSGDSGYGSAGSAYGSGSSAGSYGSGSTAGYGSGSAAGYGSGSSGYGSGSSAGSYGSGSQGFPIRLNYVSQPYGRGSSIYWESQTSYGVKCKSKRDTEDADHLISELSIYGQNQGKAVIVTFAVEIVAAGAKLKLKSPYQFESYFTPVGVVKGLFLDMFSPAKDVILISKHVSDTKFLVFAIFNEKNYVKTATFNFKLVIRTKALIAVSSGYGSGSAGYGSGSSAGYGSGSSAGYGSGSSSDYGSGSSSGYGSGSASGYGSGSSADYGSGSSAGSYGSGSSNGYGSGSSAGSYGYGSGSAGYGSGSSSGYGSGSSAGYGSGSDDSAYGFGYDFAGSYGSGPSSSAYSSSDSEYDWSDY